jgi:hypothetical protein
LENAPDLRDLIRLMGVMVDLYCASYTKPPEAVSSVLRFSAIVGFENSPSWHSRQPFSRG